MASRAASSSCGPQPNAQSPPPIAQVPRPRRVISGPFVPSLRVGRVGMGCSSGVGWIDGERWWRVGARSTPAACAGGVPIANPCRAPAGALPCPVVPLGDARHPALARPRFRATLSDLRGGSPVDEVVAVMSAETPESVALHTGPPLQAGAEPSVMASFERLARLASELLDVPCATVYLLDGDELRPANPCVAGIPPVLAAVARTVIHCVAASEGSSGAIACPDTSMPALDGVPAEATGAGVGSFAGTVLRDARSRIAGALLVSAPTRREWTSRDVQLLEQLGELAV